MYCNITTIAGRYQSGQMGLAVNQLALPSGVRIPPYPPHQFTTDDL